MFYKQCKLNRNDTITTAWIPETLAKVGKYVELKEDQGWVNGWRIEEVSNIRLEESVMLERAEDHKRTRKASDI